MKQGVRQKCLILLVRPRGFEPLAYGFVVQGSTHNFNNFGCLGVRDAPSLGVLHTLLVAALFGLLVLVDDEAANQAHPGPDASPL